MSSCPQCSNNIEDAFGIVQCSQCKAMLVADFDGNLKVSGDEQVTPEALPEVPFAIVAEEAVAPSENPSSDFNDWNLEPAEHVSEPAEQSLEAPLDSIEPLGPGDMAAGIQDINDFANSEKSSARDGILIYQVKISGIDSADLHAVVRESLEDSKLRLNVPELLKSMRDGILVIPKLNAVKASVIVSRLKEFSLEIEWSQMSLITSEVKSDATP